MSFGLPTSSQSDGNVAFNNAIFNSESSRPFLPSDAVLSSDPGLDRDQLLKESVRLQCIADKDYAQSILNLVISKHSTEQPEGWCRLCTLAPTKTNGYIQLSFEGANKFATLEEVLLWARGLDLGLGEQASHLCGRPACLEKDHIVAESEIKNQNRKGCRVWVECPHRVKNNCKKKVGVCLHVPMCIKFAPGWEHPDEFEVYGIHHE